MGFMREFSAINVLRAANDLKAGKDLTLLGYGRNIRKANKLILSLLRNMVVPARPFSEN